MRCPSCMATNPDSASFCGQCYTRFDQQDVAQPQPEQAEPDAAQPDRSPGIPDLDELPWLVTGAAASPADTTPAPDPAAPESGRVTATAGRFHVHEGGAGWTCGVCGEPNALTAFTCSVCGARMDAEEAPARLSPDEWDRVRRTEALAPGVGHIRAGSPGAGIARLGMVLLWFLGTVLLATGGTTGIIASLPMVLGILIIWATGPGDLTALQRGRDPRLDARRFMYLVIGVTVAVIVVGGIGASL